MGPMGSPDAPTSPRHAPPGVGGFDRRTLVLSAALLLAVVVGGVVAVAATSDGARGQAEEVRDGDIPPAAAIPRPGRGRAPESAGDRGGAGQIGLFAVMVVAVAGIGVVVFRGGRTARANRAKWSVAGASGHDGALDHQPPATRPPPGGSAEP